MLSCCRAACSFTSHTFFLPVGIWCRGVSPVTILTLGMSPEELSLKLLFPPWSLSSPTRILHTTNELRPKEVEIPLAQSYESQSFVLGYGIRVYREANSLGSDIQYWADHGVFTM